MLIYCPEQSNRLRYILDIIFGRILGLDYRVTHLEDEYATEPGAKICYRQTPTQQGIYIPSSGFLYETDIKDQQASIGEFFKWEGLPAFFAVNQEASIPFDLFGAAFYLLSRYEEYLPFEPDEHGRFTAKQSLAYREGFLQKPLINLWALKLLDIIKKGYPEVSAKPASFQIEATFDIDNAWAFKHKGLRSLAGLVKPESMAFRNYRYQVLIGNQNDPYDQYARIAQLMSTFGLTPTFFFLLSKKGPYDRGIKPTNKALRKLIKSIDQTDRTGIHPSYRSGDHQQLLRKEIQDLQGITKQPVTRSRQHFLRLPIPDTYVQLEEAGIREDYSMGYPDQTGYRASIGIPFPFFNLVNNRAAELTVFPFQVMDVTLRQYLGLSPAEATRQVKNLIDEAVRSGCHFCFLWHNESLSEWQVWEGWSGVLESILEMATEA